jgi:hypothetical protein
VVVDDGTGAPPAPAAPPGPPAAPAATATEEAVVEETTGGSVVLVVVVVVVVVVVDVVGEVVSTDLVDAGTLAVGAVVAGTVTGLSGNGDTKLVGRTTTIDGTGAGVGAVGTCVGRLGTVEPVKFSMRAWAAARSFDS